MKNENKSEKKLNAHRKEGSSVRFLLRGMTPPFNPPSRGEWVGATLKGRGHPSKSPLKGNNTPLGLPSRGDCNERVPHENSPFEGG